MSSVEVLSRQLARHLSRRELEACRSLAISLEAAEPSSPKVGLAVREFIALEIRLDSGVVEVLRDALVRRLEQGQPVAVAEALARVVAGNASKATTTNQFLSMAPTLRALLGVTALSADVAEQARGVDRSSIPFIAAGALLLVIALRLLLHLEARREHEQAPPRAEQTREARTAQLERDEAAALARAPEAKVLLLSRVPPAVADLSEESRRRALLLELELPTGSDGSPMLLHDDGTHTDCVSRLAVDRAGRQLWPDEASSSAHTYFLCVPAQLVTTPVRVAWHSRKPSAPVSVSPTAPRLEPRPNPELRPLGFAKLAAGEREVTWLLLVAFDNGLDDDEAVLLSDGVDTLRPRVFGYVRDGTTRLELWSPARTGTAAYLFTAQPSFAPKRLVVAGRKLALPSDAEVKRRFSPDALASLRN